MCVKNKMTNNGPMWAPHGLKFQYRTHIGPFLGIMPGFCPHGTHLSMLAGEVQFVSLEKSNYGPPKYDVFLISKTRRILGVHNSIFRYAQIDFWISLNVSLSKLNL